MERFESIRNCTVSVIVILTFLFGVFGGAQKMLVGSIEDAIGNLESKVGSLENTLGVLEIKLGSLESKVEHIDVAINDIRGDIKVINNILYNHMDSRLSRIERKLGIAE